NDLLFDGYVENIAEYTHQFLVGAECGYDEGLKLIGKGTTCDRLEKAAAILSENEISRRADFSFILGLSWETHAEVEKTIRFAINLFSNYDVRILLQWYAQIPGSRLWEEDRKRGLVNETMYNEYGFFRNLHLFLSGVKLSPRDVWEIEERIGQIQWMASLVATNPRIRPIENAFPEPIAQYFPRETVFEDIDDLDGTGLPSLRQVSRPPRLRRANPCAVPAMETRSTVWLPAGMA